MREARGEVLAHDRVTADGAEPRAWLYVLHGIFGAGRNWGTVIRRVVRARPEWGALLIDLRAHGASQGLPAPHTIGAAARDLEELSAHTGIAATAVLGHSFGGKVAMLFARDAGAEARKSLRQIWVIDSTPAPAEPGGAAWRMLNIVRALPSRFATREDLVDALVEHGMARGVAQWMATNLEPHANSYQWRLDFDAMESLIRSFYDADVWSVVENPPEGTEVHLVKAEESDVLSGEVLARVERAAAAGTAFLHRVEGGHWVNAENPEAVEALLVQMLPPA